MVSYSKMKEDIYIPENSNVYPVVFFLLITILSYIIMFCGYDLYYQTKGSIIVNDGNYYIELYVNINDLDKVSLNKNFIHNKKSYQYEVIEVSLELYKDDQNITNYKKIIIKSKLPNRLLIEHNIIDLSINYKRQLIGTLIYNYIIGKEN